MPMKRDPKQAITVTRVKTKSQEWLRENVDRPRKMKIIASQLKFERKFDRLFDFVVIFRLIIND